MLKNLRKLFPRKTSFKTTENYQVQKSDLQQQKQNELVSSFYRQTNEAFPNMIPRLIRFTWSDLVIYCEVFFVGWMVYIHFIDV